MSVWRNLYRKLFLPPLSSKISSEAIVWAYRLFLGREPENQAIIDEKVARLSDLQAVRREFLQSEEFQRSYRGRRRPTMSGHEPSMLIDATSSDEELQLILEHLHATWQYLGETEPYWSVLTVPKYRKENIQQTHESFYDSGQSSANQFFATLSRNGVDPATLTVCLEYGCGVGRVTYWLAQRFQTVYGYDISRPHLREAESFLNSKGLTNVALRQVRLVKDIQDFPQVDAIYSVLVLQHNPPPVISLILHEFMRALNPGGVAFFHVPTYRQGYGFFLQQYLQHDATQHNDMEMHVLPQRHIFEIVQHAGGKVLEVTEDGSASEQHEQVVNTFLVQKE